MRVSISFSLLDIYVFYSTLSIKNSSVFKALATKMTEELEFLKHSGGPGGMGGATITDKNWRNRRSQKLDKMELLNLQSSLQSEIQAKQTISEELTKTRSDLIAAQKYVYFSF